MNNRKVFLVLTVLLTASSLKAAQITTTYKGNPAYITAILDTSCERAVDYFERSAGKILMDLPFVTDARVMSQTPYKDSEKTDLYTRSTKTLNISVTPTLTKEFPTTFMPVTVYRNLCDMAKVTPTQTCVTSFTITFDGSKAVVYQKVIEATTSQDWMSSFMGTMSFTALTPSTCTFSNQLYQMNSNYLWAKRHLLKGVNPTLVESRVLERFLNWATATLPAMEGK